MITVGHLSKAERTRYSITSMDAGFVNPHPASGSVAVEAPRATNQLPLAMMGWFLLLLAVLFFPVLRLMVHEWATYEEMGHAFFVPVVAGYIVWKDRDRILAQPV